MVKIIPSATETAEKPWPRPCRCQAGAGPCGGHFVNRPVSLEILSWLGPRKQDQPPLEPPDAVEPLNSVVFNPAKGVVMTGSASNADVSDFFLECVLAVVFEDFALEDLRVVVDLAFGVLGVADATGLSDLSFAV